MAHQDEQELKQKQSDTAAVNLPRGEVKVSALYDGAELRSFEGRPGAMDAFKLPSRVLEQIVYPRGVRK